MIIELKVNGNWEHKALLRGYKTCGWVFQLLFPPWGADMRRAEEDLSWKETFPGAEKLVGQGSGNGLDLSFSPILQILCDFLLVHLARLIFQINKPSSELSDTLNHRGRTKAVCMKSAADRPETSLLSVTHSPRRQTPTLSLRVLSMSGLQSALGRIQKLTRANLRHCYTLLTFVMMMGFLFGVWLFLLFVLFCLFFLPENS